VAANARPATLGGGEYLLSRLDPATPPELADAVRSFANNRHDIGMNQLVGVPNTDPTAAARLSEAQASSQQIVGLTPDGGHLTGGTAGPAGRMPVCRASVGSTPRSFGSRLPAW